MGASKGEKKARNKEYNSLKRIFPEGIGKRRSWGAVGINRGAHNGM